MHLVQEAIAVLQKVEKIHVQWGGTNCSMDLRQGLLKENDDIHSPLRDLSAEFRRNLNAESDVDLHPLADVECNFSVSPENIFRLLCKPKSRNQRVLILFQLSGLSFAAILILSITTKNFPCY